MTEDFLRSSNTLTDLLGYLDSVETTVASDFVLPDISQATNIHREFSNKISDLESSLQDAKKKEEVANEQMKKLISEVEKEKETFKLKLNKKLAKQKTKYEEALGRHQQMIDTLLKEKESLAQEVQKMNKRVLVAREEANRREKEVQEAAATQIAQQRELAIAQERARNKKTLEQRTKEIKEETVKALQPELENLIAKQKRELEQIREEKEEEIRAAKAAFERRAEEDRTRLIEQLERERKSEYAAMEQRLQSQLERERKLHSAELDRMILKLQQAEEQKTGTIETARTENDAILEEMRERWKAELAAEQLKHQQEMDKLRENIQAEVEVAKRVEEDKLRRKEDQIRKQIEAEIREKSQKKIEIVVKKLEEETDAEKKRIMEECERKVNEIQKQVKTVQYSLDEEKHRSAMQIEALKRELYDEKSMSTRLEKENERLVIEIENYKLNIQNLSIDIKTKTDMITKTNENAERRETDIRSEYQAEILRLRKEVDDIRARWDNDKISWAEERSSIKQQNQEELETVSKKVKGLIEQKDQTISSLKEQLKIAQDRLLEADKLFHQQKTILAPKISCTNPRASVKKL